MAKLTNKLSLPAPYVEAVARQDALYDKGDAAISVSGLINPPQLIELGRRHAEAMTEDVADRGYALMGQLMAEVLARNSSDALTNAVDDLLAVVRQRSTADLYESLKGVLTQLGLFVARPITERFVLTERRFAIDCLGWKVSGRSDRVVAERHLGGWVITDHKLGSIYEADGPRPEREQQLNLYAEILRSVGIGPIVGLQNSFFFRDWSKPKAKANSSYPQHQFAIIPATLWEPSKARGFMEERVRLHQAARAIVDDAALPACSDEDRWKDPERFAVKKSPKSIRASRVLATKQEAEMWLATQDAKKFKEGFVEFRPSVPRRCGMYCTAGQNNLCFQFAREFPDGVPIDVEQEAE